MVLLGLSWLQLVQSRITAPSRALFQVETFNCGTVLKKKMCDGLCYKAQKAAVILMVKFWHLLSLAEVILGTG